MKMFIMAVRDRAADVFGTPMFRLNVGGAVRAFSDEINRPGDDNVMSKHPEDFDLYELGIYDDADASFKMLASPRQVCVGKDVVTKSVVPR